MKKINRFGLVILLVLDIMVSLRPEYLSTSAISGISIGVGILLGGVLLFADE